MARQKSKSSAAKPSANFGFEAKLLLTADKLRNNMGAAEYKRVVLALIVLNDPAYGSGGMFVQSEKFGESHA